MGQMQWRRMTLGICPVFLHESADLFLCLRQKEREKERENDKELRVNIQYLLRARSVDRKERVFPKLITDQSHISFCQLSLMSLQQYVFDILSTSLPPLALCQQQTLCTCVAEMLLLKEFFVYYSQYFALLAPSGVMSAFMFPPALIGWIHFI